MAKQTTFRTADAMPNANISLPFGIISTVRAGFRRLGLYEFLDSFKEKGVPLSYVVELMCIYQLQGCSSMNECGQKVSSQLMKEELCHGYTISRKTIERSLKFLDLHFEDVIEFIWKRLREIYPDINTDVYADGSHIKRYGSKGNNTAAGEGGGTVQLQDQFMVAQLKDSGLPVMIEMYPGNWNDPPQYDDFIPQLMFYLNKGSMIIMDNGGSNKELLDDIRDSGMDYLTRVRMNASDDVLIDTDAEKIEYVSGNVLCLRHEFESSDKTNYLFFSSDRYSLGQSAALRRAARLAEQMKEAKEVKKDPKLNRLVNVKKNPFYELTIDSYHIDMNLDPWLEDDIITAAKEVAGDRCGWFKLQCSKRLSSLEALETYRHRVGIEHLISSIKTIVNINPLRVWAETSVRGSLLMALTAQLQLSMVRYELEPDAIDKMIDGKMTRCFHKPSNKTICDSLIHWTVTVIPRDGWRKERIFSNENELTGRISAVLERF